MSILKDILLEMNLLMEDASVNNINDAIKNMLMVKISYDDLDGGEGKGEREICPVAYGISTNGNPVVRAFQTAGSTKHGVPQWKLFKLNGIKTWDNMENKKYNPEDLVGFNKDGDKQMDIIYTIAPIGSAKDIEISKSQGMPDDVPNGPVDKQLVNNAGKQEKERDNTNNKKEDNYTADNAIDDLLKNATGTKFVQKIDNGEKNNYINNTIEAPESEPVKKDDLIGGEKNVSNEEGEKQEERPIDNEPVKKTDLQKEPEEDDENGIKKSFDDMMNRMNNIDKENEQ